MLAGEVRGLGSRCSPPTRRATPNTWRRCAATQERQLLELSLEVRQNQWRDADWQVQALHKTKEGAQARLRYYQNLITDGLNAEELGYETLTGVSMASEPPGNMSEAFAAEHRRRPGLLARGRRPDGQPAVVQPAAGRHQAGGRIRHRRPDHECARRHRQHRRGLSLTQAGWERREAEWRQQVEVIVDRNRADRTADPGR